MARPPIDPIGLSRVLTESAGVSGVGPGAAAAGKPATGNIFEDVLNKAMESLQGVSATENKTDALIQGYLDGKVDLMDVMTASSELSMVVQLATTVATQAVASFKEITSIQI